MMGCLNARLEAAMTLSARHNLKSLRLRCIALTLSAAIVIPGNAQSRTDILRGTRHPTEQNVPVVSDPGFILRPSGITGKPAFPDTSGYSTVTIGVLEGEHHEMLGNIRDVADDYHGTLFVLDAGYDHVRAYDYAGSLISTFSGPGDGPGELRNPWKLMIMNNGKMIAVVGGARRVNIFQRRGSTFHFKSSFAKTVPGRTGCAMNGYLYLLGFSHGIEGIIHKFTPEGQLVSSFGPPYKADDPFVRSSQSARGMLACNEEHSIVGWIRENVPVFTGFTESGELAWRVKFDGFKPFRVIETVDDEGRARITYTVPELGESIFENVFSDSSGDFYVRYSTMMEAVGRGFKTARHLFRINARTGEGEYVGTSAHVHAVDGDRVISTSNRPFPQVLIHTRKKQF